MTLAPAGAAVPAGAAALTAAVAAMWDQRKEEILARVTVLDDAVVGLLQGDLDDDRRQEAVRAAHRLAGAVGTFGFHEGSRLAREVEQLLDTPELPEVRSVPRLSALVLALRDELERPCAAPVAVPVPGPPAAPPVTGHLLVVDDDEVLAARVAAAAAAEGFDAEVAAGPSAAREAVLRRRPAAVLLDLGFPDGSGDALGLLGELSAADVPVFVLTASSTFTDRMAAARHGATGFLEKALPLPDVMAAVRQSLAPVVPTAPTVLAVDDDPVVLEALRVLLGDAGLVAHTLEDPRRIFDALVDTAPDLLLLDYDLPHATGAELCRALRNEPRWAALPVIFLTAQRDGDTMQRMVDAGGDDYLRKPVVGAELVARITNRLERARLIDEPAEPPAAAAVVDGPAAEPSARAATVDVVVVEDDEVLAPLILHALETRGYSARWLRNGQDAADALTGSLAPRLVLLDWDLPGLNGLAVLGAMARSGALERTRAVMLTGRSTEAEILQALELGAVDHVAKPFSLPVLMQRVRTELTR